MRLPDYKLTEMLAYEAFIRRAAEIDMPFMLKGSYVTRQYFNDPMNRIPADMDWLYTAPINDISAAEDAFSNWATAVTEHVMHDGVVFTSFNKHAFWRMLDYAMADDFPTVNTDLSCTVEGEELGQLQLDISFNLPVDVPPVPLLYKPLSGKPFIIPYTAPIGLQVAWKLHQTLVSLRWKDIFDLINLLQHPLYNEEAVEQTVHALINECLKDNINLYQINILTTDFEDLFRPISLNDSWNLWRHKQSLSSTLSVYDYAENITNAALLPYNLSVFKQQFTDGLRKSGFTEYCYKKIQSFIQDDEPTSNPMQNIEAKVIDQPIKNQDQLQRKPKSFLHLLRRLFK